MEELRDVVRGHEVVEPEADFDAEAVGVMLVHQPSPCVLDGSHDLNR